MEASGVFTQNRLARKGICYGRKRRKTKITETVKDLKEDTKKAVSDIVEEVKTEA